MTVISITIKTQRRTSNKKKYETLAELLYILRPIAYVLSIIRFGEKSWKGFLLSLGIDIISIAHYLRKVPQLSDVQQDEISRRFLSLMMYFLRSPLFDVATIKLFTVSTSGDNQSYKDKFFDCIREYLTVYQEKYFYTSAS